ncbi:MAG: hypothetical protein LUD68_09625, partial [Rikenellaceae bacterium]|nr:hypothetical protein [Rikenellaceae bacterium]
LQGEGPGHPIAERSGDHFYAPRSTPAWRIDFLPPVADNLNRAIPGSEEPRADPEPNQSLSTP